MIDFPDDVFLGLSVHFFDWVSSYLTYWYGKSSSEKLNQGFRTASMFASRTHWKFPEGVVAQTSVTNMEKMQALTCYLPFVLAQWKDPIVEVATLFSKCIKMVLVEQMTEEQMIEAQSQISRYSIYLFFNIIQQGQNDDENPVSQVLSKQIQIWEVAPH